MKNQFNNNGDMRLTNAIVFKFTKFTKFQVQIRTLTFSNGRNSKSSIQFHFIMALDYKET